MVLVFVFVRVLVLDAVPVRVRDELDDGTRDLVPVTEAAAVWDGVPVPVGAAVPVPDADADAVGVTVALTDAVSEAVADTEAVEVGDSDGVAVREPLTLDVPLRVPLPVPLGRGEPLRVPVPLTLALGVTLPVSDGVADRVAEGDEEMEGGMDGEPVCDGATELLGDWLGVGKAVGLSTPQGPLMASSHGGKYSPL